MSDLVPRVDAEECRLDAKGVTGHAVAMRCVRVSRAESPGSAGQGETRALKDASRRLTKRLGRARPLRAGLPTEVGDTR
jgi:hypothetical protein